MPELDFEKIAPRLEEFLARLLRAANLQLKFQIRPCAPNPANPEAPEIAVGFTGPDTDILLGHGGEVLEALEEVSTRFLRLPTEERGRVAFDSNDFRALRIEELRLTAETAAERVAHTSTPFPLNPMNSRDRRVIHLALKGNPAVRTESEGGGPYRKVIIFPAEAKK